MIKVFAVCVLVVAAACGVIAAKEAGVFNSGLPQSLPAPTDLIQVRQVGTNRIATGQWIKHSSVQFGAASNVSSVSLQVELTRNGGSPQGKPYATGPVWQRSSQAHAGPFVAVHNLNPGTYRWWARVYNGKAVSPWVPFSSGAAFGVDTVKPSAPVISSVTDPVQGKVYRSGNISFSWHASDGGSGIAGYWYRFSPSSSLATHRLPGVAVALHHGHVRTTGSTLRLTHKPSGTYTLAVAGCDKAGNWSRVSTYRVKLDSTPPKVSGIGFSTFDFNPHYSTMTMNYVVTKPSWVHVGIYRASDNKLVRFVVRRSTSNNELLHYTWRGRDNHGQIVAPGAYNFYVRVTDKYGNTSLREFSDLTVLNKVIIVSLTQERLWAYEGHHVVATSLVTTGNSLLPTPTGTFTILDKRSHFTFISPFPKGAWDYYDPSTVNYVMLFRAGGYYLHDAPWRTVYGPGSNSEQGAPGSNYTGTHGCVNIPEGTMSFLYNWTPEGTPVRILG